MLVAVAVVLAGHAGVAAGRATSGALFLVAVQACAWALLLWSALPGRWRWLGPGAGAVVLAGVVGGGAVSAETGLQAAAGLAHALIYGALLVAFGSSLRRGRAAVLTVMARRINPHFRPGMVPYTRRVTWVWCGFAAAQLAASALLLSSGHLTAWLLLVGTLHAPLAAGLALGEFLVRRWRFPGEHTSFAEMIRAIRRAG